MGFSAEMKDFINAYKTGQQINASKTDQEYKDAKTQETQKKTERDNDPARLKLEDDQARANLAKTNASIGLTQEQIKNAGVSRGYTAALTKRLADGPAVGAPTNSLAADGYGGDPVGPTGPMPPRAAIPLTPEGNLAYAEGGAIPDLDDEEEEPMVGPAAQPAPAAAMAPPAVGGTSDATDISARRRGPQSGLPQGGYNGVISPALVSDAIRGGYKFGTQALGKGARGQAAARAIAQGAGALSPDEMEMARKAVDPEGRMTESQRNMAALGSVYQFYANKGQPERAEKVAFQMLQHYRNASQRYAAIAAKAAEQGNVDMATQAAMKAYANVPDGRDMMLQVSPDGKIAYTYTDENGKTITKGLATPQDIGAAAMGLARGGFDQALLSAAGAREAASQPQAATRGKKAAATEEGGAVGPATAGGKPDREYIEKTVEGGMATAQKDWQKANNGKELNEKEWGATRDTATHLARENPDLTGDEVIRAAQELSRVTKGSEVSPKFKVISSEGGINTIKMSDGTTVRMSEEALEPILNRRAEGVKAFSAAEAQAKKDAETPTWGQKVGKRASAIAGIVADDARKFAGEISDMVPTELKERGKSAIHAAKRFDEDAGAVLNNPNINYGTLTTAIKKGVSSAIEALQSGTKNPGAIPDEHDAPM